MIRTTLLAAALSASGLLLAPPATAQISQSDLQSRYDRALAAGYKAMFLCSAIANAERNGTTRTAESVMAWELTGIQGPLNDIVDDLPFEIIRTEGGLVDHVRVEWDDAMVPRMAVHSPGEGCVITPIGFTRAERAEDRPAPPPFRPVAPWRSGDAGTLPVAAAFNGSYGADSRTTAVIVLSDALAHGRAEFYAEGFDGSTPQRTWSVAKSIAATLIGAAVQRGDADVYASAGLGEGEGDPRAAITIDQALRMASGRFSDTPGNRTDPLYFGGASVDEVAVDWPLIAAPGSTFRYANNDTLAAVQAIEPTLDAHSPARLFATLRMQHTVAETDWQGNYILSSQVWSTARDLAKLGQLHLDDGVLHDGTRLLPEGWVAYISTPSGPQPGGSRGWGYGAGWWLFNNSDGIPSDTFFAAGNRGQYVVVVPSRDVVIVRRGEDPAGGSGFDIEAFTRDVLAALEE